MKVKLYHKFVEAARKHAFNHKYSRKWLFKPNASKQYYMTCPRPPTDEFVCKPCKKLDDGTIVKDDKCLIVVGPYNFLSTVWKELLWCETWRKKYRKYSRNYWEPDVVLKRVVETGKKED